MSAEPGTPATPVTGVGLEPALDLLVVDAARQALAALGLDGRLAALTISADDLPGAEEAWLELRRVARGARPALALYCHPEVFAAPRPATATVYPPRAVWERVDPRDGDVPVPASAFARGRADAFLHHHLLWASDVLDDALRPPEIPGSVVEAFTACWAVTVDGRLARRGLPGYALVERRGRFSRLFSTAGVLMPEHWKSFQGLWDGLIERPREIVTLARRLPRLQPASR